MSERLTSPEEDALEARAGADFLWQRAHALVENIAARAEQAERDGMVPVENVEEMKEAGLFRGLQSRHYGGLEAPPDDFFAAVVEIGTACPSTSWVLAIMGVHAFEMAQLPIELQDEIYGDDPNTLISSSYAPQGQITRAAGGFRLTGQWKSSSGVDHAQWVVLGGRLDGGDGKPSSNWTFHIPKKDVRTYDDWQVLGLKGTGSKSVILDDVFVPEHRANNREAGINPEAAALNCGPLYKVPRPLIYQVPGGAPALGAVKAAYQEFLRQTKAYVSRRSGTSPIDDPHVQVRVSSAKRIIESSEYLMTKALRDVTDCVYAGEELSEELLARATRDVGQVADDCVTAMRLIFECLGASVVYSSNPLQRYYRDILTARQHGTQNPYRGATAFARSEMGLPQLSPSSRTPF